MTTGDILIRQGQEQGTKVLLVRTRSGFCCSLINEGHGVKTFHSKTGPPTAGVTAVVPSNLMTLQERVSLVSMNLLSGGVHTAKQYIISCVFVCCCALVTA